MTSNALAFAAGTAPRYDEIATDALHQPLADGTRLAVKLFRPAVKGEAITTPLPVALWRTPYNQASCEEVATYFAHRGYAAVVQDVRGRGESEGIFYPFAHEGPDGCEAIEWIAAQPWCNGKVGTSGPSYVGAVQNALACHNPPHLTAMIPIFGPSSYFHSSMRHNGALEMRFYVYAFTMAASSPEAERDPGLKQVFDQAVEQIWDWVKAWPIRAGETPLCLLPSYEQWAIDISTRACYDDYWRQTGYGPRPCYESCADVPTLYIGGWYDSYTRSTLENFLALRPRQKQPVHTIMGPWQHNVATPNRVGDLSLEPDGCFANGMRGIQQRWFDRWLMELDNGVDREPPVRYFVMGGGDGSFAKEDVIHHGGQWQTADSWPPDTNRQLTFYLHRDGSLTEKAPTLDEDATSYTFDPRRPVPTIGGNISALGIDPGGFDQRGDDRFPFCDNHLPLASRQDVLCFQTPPLAEDLVLAGPVEVCLYVATDGRDTDFTAKLLDIYPPSADRPEGAAINLTDSIQRLRFRDGYEEEHLVEPGDIVELRFALYPTANRFVAGHRLRVDISSSNFPRFDVNPNTGGPLGRDRTWRCATNTLYHDQQHPSQLLVWQEPTHGG